MKHKKLKGTVVVNRSTSIIFVQDVDGQTLEIKYYKNSQVAFANLLQLHNISNEFMIPPDPWNEQIVEQLCIEVGISRYELWMYSAGKVTKVTKNLELAVMVSIPEIRVLIKNHTAMLMYSTCQVTKCDECGRNFKTTHTCNIRRRHFYFHNVNSYTADWWEEIQFFPIGAHPQTKRLFITYDVETYTWHGRCGKQLIPFMLVFHIDGHKDLIHHAVQVAHKTGWTNWEQNKNVFYHLNPEKRIIGHKFKQFRQEIQLTFTRILWKHFIQKNPQLQNHIEQFGLKNLDDVTPDILKKMKLQGSPEFIEIYLTGHNINGFDEIVIAAQVIQNKTDVCNAFTITRNFMPRNGKILFNDITFGLPNPMYEKRKTYERWHDGSCEDCDFKMQYVKFLVRDTFALTHTSLRNAAKAYNLPVEKGCCPYKAVNEFYMKGSYLVDRDGFPQPFYWKDMDEYSSNKEMWLTKKEPYDIIKYTLNYCVQDVIVTSQLVFKLLESYKDFIKTEVGLPQCEFNILQRPTISSNSHAIFRQILYSDEKEEKTTLGSTLLAPSKEMYDFIRASIRGGRCYPTYIGVLEEPIYVYDICGMYASALTHPFPSGQPLAPFDRKLAVRQWELKLKNQKNISYFDAELLPGIFVIDADPPSEEMLDTLPPFCSRKGGRLVWTNESLRGETCTSIDVITLHNRGWKVKLIPSELTTIFPEWKCLAKNYVQLNIKAKEKADKEKNQTVRSIAKLLSNALYGSFATKLDNKKIVFGDQIAENSKDIANGKFSIKSTSFIETDDYCAEILPEFTVQYGREEPQTAVETAVSENDGERDETVHLYTFEHAQQITYKPIILLDADDEELCLHTLEKNSDIIENNRYPSQIASFVLAWTRAFVSEWALFLFKDDYGTPIEERDLKAVYGDTDSMFLTKKGRECMEKNGKKRLKKYGGNLIFNEQEPDLTWLVECETQCEKCASDAYSSESVFLAPKLYALKNTVCDVCKHEGKGKLRAKGHATEELNYNIMLNCYYSDYQKGSETYSTSRLTLKRTLASAQAQTHPFTVTEATLTRTLRPWKDMTLTPIDQHRLKPYSNSNPNPRNQECCLMELPWNM